jgi:sRNA-binding carbon storage regulator CsrA
LLVVSRKLSESMVIDDVVVLTVSRLSESAAELTCATIDGGFLQSATLRRNESLALPRGVRVVLIEFRLPRLRLGFDYPDDVSISRKEEWDKDRDATEGP